MRLAIAFVIAASVAAPSFAQSTASGGPASPSQPQKTTKPKTPRPPIGARAFFTFDTSMMSASQSFKTVTDSSVVLGYGAGGEILNIWKAVFARVAWAGASTSGERSFVVDGAIVRTGIPVDIGIRTFEIGAGWRTRFPNQPKVVVYYGGGLLVTSYSEVSPGATDEENVRESFTGYSAQAGLELALSSVVTAAFEGQYRAVPNALGTGGVSQAYGETSLGGVVVRVMIGIRIGK